MSDINVRFNQLDKQVTEVRNAHNKKLVQLDFQKSKVKEVKDKLNQRGINFSSKAELQQRKEELTTSLNSAMDSIERKLAEVKAQDTNLNY